MTTAQLVRLAIVSAVLSALCIVTIDAPVARYIATHETYGAAWDDVLRVLEYAIGIEPWKFLGVAVLVAGVLASLLVPRLRPQAHAWVLVAFVHVLARNLSLWLKFAFGRLRPPKWLAHDGGDTFFEGGSSFPSGHAILFASIVLPLIVVYPRLRPVLAIVAFAMAARIAVNAHFVSDTFAGVAATAAITWGCAALVRRALPWPSPQASPR